MHKCANDYFGHGGLTATRIELAPAITLVSRAISLAQKIELPDTFDGAGGENSVPGDFAVNADVYDLLDTSLVPYESSFMRQKLDGARRLLMFHSSRQAFNRRGVDAAEARSGERGWD